MCYIENYSLLLIKNLFNIKNYFHFLTINNLSIISYNCVVSTTDDNMSAEVPLECIITEENQNQVEGS